MRRGFRCPRGVLATAAIILVLPACGTSEPDDPESAPTNLAGEVSVGPDGVQSITLQANDDYRFVPAEFTVVPGQVSVTLDNIATQLTHSLVYPMDVNPAEVTESIPVVAPEESRTISFGIETPGDYTFICSFHEALGHTGVMTVEPAP